MVQSKNSSDLDDSARESIDIVKAADVEDHNPVEGKPSTGVAAANADEAAGESGNNASKAVRDSEPAAIETGLKVKPEVTEVIPAIVSIETVTDKSHIDDELVDEPIDYSTKESRSNFNPNYQPENAYRSERNTGAPVSNTILPPPKPRRPTPPPSPEETLKEAFPGISPSIITAVLIASNGELGPAFNALLSMSDPSFKPDLPLRKNPQQPVRSSQSQIEEDERLARRLAQDYEKKAQRKNPNVINNNRRMREETESNHDAAQHTRNKSGSDDGFNFLEEEFPQIKATIEKGLNETKTTINTWMKNFQKKFEENIENNLAPRFEDEPSSSSNTKRGLFGALGGSPILPSKDDNRYGYSNSRIMSRNDSRRNVQTKSDEVTNGVGEINLNDEYLMGAQSQKEFRPSKPARPVSSRTQSENSELLGASAEPASKPESKSGHTWETLNMVEHMPEKDQESFFIGDSDDEEDDEEEIPSREKRQESAEISNTKSVQSDKPFEN
ncbi:hypothetical protein NADFUDRAFT_82659 [Nadsonia fulvescens var. elongata DSM 6958]|uniref:CUE domain-containing protein n=1 Tax=Nadsonia fulvescens var. elongata DSM 6958 TaxID=857566 RepID=A0A1E3PKD5_9ASCO|nr:hypothetical protein NADFUDRAFT_82659 [Nadsonia fulvescens var. elongata DSM 6958]